jgi:hypothetical protein
VLLGSGPLDRDETIGRNKPFKDIAWGLASRGVAVLRFDKVTYAHPRDASLPDGYTILDQYLPSAVAAVNLLRHHSRVDRARVSSRAAVHHHQPSTNRRNTSIRTSWTTSRTG